ncbi:PLP-dependent aminotransferase family protein [Tianweitania populi]|uniref:GntR family transcriptional regulator n=1 Tax=Tianweitania populi TaxID=1607949 RepID=A0A8J3DVH9_9HYPH|nr:PLP-dependent aminotransferase family protein [Tianweitania populi]GHD09908.1 GntR family transcriptional regulator [Tianweitania populi]
MTKYTPQLPVGRAPLYTRLADQLELDINEGRLEAGAKLPPQRDLAYELGATVGTIGRAYALVRERGLVSGEVGRGTYVLARNTPHEKNLPHIGIVFEGTRHQEPSATILRFDSTAAPDVGQSEPIGTILADIVRDHPAELASYTRTFPFRWLEAGAIWLSRAGHEVNPEHVVPTLGAHPAVLSVIASVTAPGDHIVYEHATYSQIARSAGLIGRRPCLVASDENGVIPQDFQRLCAQRHPKLAFLMPTAQNPTVRIMPAERRVEIAEIARAHNVWLVEDDIYGALSNDTAPLLTSLAPERTFLVGGLSKSVAAGIRGGWLACPPQYAPRIRVAHKMLTGGMPFLLAELCARLILSGTAAELRKRVLGEVNARLDMARTILDGLEFSSAPNIPFLWLALPEPWLSSTFKNAAAERGVQIDDEDEFKPARTEQVFHRVRLGISSVATREDVQRGLQTIRSLIDEGPAGYDTFG